MKHNRCRWTGTINRIEIPLPMRDFKDYILTIPEIAPGLPQGLANFFMRLIIPVPAMNAIAIVTEAFDPTAASSSVLPFIFDIIGKYLSSISKRNHVMTPKEGGEAQLRASRMPITFGMSALSMRRQIRHGLLQCVIEPCHVPGLQGLDNPA